MIYNKYHIIRACTVSQSINFVRGTLQDLKKKYEVLLLSSPGPEMEEVINQHGVRGINISMERHISPLKDFISLIKIIKAFRSEKPLMVHSMTPKAGLLCMIAAWLTKVPLRVHTFTGLVWPTSSGIIRKILMMTDRITCACATHIIPEGEGVKNDLLNNGITKKHIKVLGYGNVKGVDMDYFSRSPEIMQMAKELKDENKFTFLFVGRIVKDKGVNELVNAFSKLNSNYPDSRLILVGPHEDNLDPILPQTKNLIENHPQIQAVGSKKGNDLIAYYAASDGFVMPSYREGFPNTVIEAGAMELPCIVTDINGSREIIKDGENGLIVPSKDENALCDAMEKILCNKEVREFMSSNARKMIATRFEQSFVRQCLYDFYDEIISEYESRKH